MGKYGLDNFINRIFEDDCLNVLPNIPDKSIDMILCDLPYGTTQNKWDSVIPLDKLWKQYNRIIKDNGVIALTSQLSIKEFILTNYSKINFKQRTIF